MRSSAHERESHRQGRDGRFAGFDYARKQALVLISAVAWR